MILSIQLKLILFSFLYGIFFSIFLKLNKKIVYNENKFIKIFSTILFIIVSVLLYFVILLKLNYAILHIYSLIMIVIGFILENIIELKIIEKNK